MRRPNDAAAAENAGDSAYIRVASRPGDGLWAAAPGDEHMIRATRLAAAFAFAAGLTAAGAAPAQDQNGGGAPASASDQTAPLPATTLTPSDSDDSQHVYSVTPPAGSPDPDLPGTVGGYARSVAGCVLVGCDDGPQVGGQPSAPMPDQPAPPQQPPSLPSSDPH